MKFFFTYLLIVISVCFVSTVQATPLPAISIHLISDQRVYITGETVWIDGWLKEDAEVKIIRIKLLDRFGKKKQEVLLKNESGNFKGFLSLPNNLSSDLYFVEANISGRSSVQELYPIMVIQPASAASLCKDSIKLQTHINNVQHALKLKTDKREYKNREKVLLDLSGLDNMNRLSVSVNKKDELSDYMDSLLAFKMPLSVHPAKGIAETEGHHFKIKIVSKSTGSPLKEVRAFAALLGGKARLSSGTSNENGEVEFILPLFEQETSLVFFTEKQLEEKVSILFEEEEDAAVPISFPCLQLNPSMASAIEERIWNSKASFLYQGTDRLNVSKNVQDSTDFYGKSDKKYLLDEYVRYPVLEEVMAEFIHEARVKEVGNERDKIIQVLNTPAKVFFNAQALILLDGVPVWNAGKLLEMNPLLIQSIEVVARKYYQGDKTWEGIIHFKTYNKDLSGFSLPSAYLLFPFRGIQESNSPLYEQPKSTQTRMPYLSNVIFHKSVQLQKKNQLQLEFTTNDALGNFKIDVIVSNLTGKDIRNHLTIDVKER